PCEGKRVNFESAIERFGIRLLAEKQLVQFRNRESIGIAMHELDGRERLHFAFVRDREVETAATAGEKAPDHILAIEADGELIAGQARLRHSENSGADLQLITDAERVFPKALSREILAEVSVNKIGLG